ncbi:Fic family protein [Nocardioides sp. Root140]|uniref:Fic family protein n=1 Tax=Nocardioides sp. Root140 TaxID=1736460 RepID=UPI0006FE6761|nr:Fic family protein [Nocardioides sp. Root140]KQY56435.1 addiction module protein [Nocardioides sp. Root140]KRF13833.1 addiction module protein [Nocardioides sp. Soil797]
MPWSPEAPFNDLPPLPPEGIDLEPKPVLKATVEARTALATLAQAGQLLPNPNILIHAVPLLEAQASSEIENIVTTADELFMHVESGGGDHATKEALRYRNALFAGVESIRNRPLTSSTAARICSELQGREIAVRAVPGTRIANPTTRQVVYAPPEGADLIGEKLSAWERFIHAEDDLDPLVRMAVAHYQFEAIHPFHDGNGRTGRVINILMLIEAGLLHDPILYLSRAIIARKNDYYRLLRAVTAEDAWIEWIIYMLDVVRESATSTTRKIGAIRTCQDDIAERARDATPGGRDAQFLEVLFDQPYCRIGAVASRCDVSRQTASSWLHALVVAGLLSDVKVGRERLFVNHEFLDVLTRAE